MKLEQQLVSLELAKKLKELGVKQESYFWYYPVYGEKISGIQTYKYVIYPLNKSGNNKYPAYTVAELGELLPYWTGDKEISLPSKANKNVNGGKLDLNWFLSYKMYSDYADTEADARAKMLIYLLENKLIEL